MSTLANILDTIDNVDYYTELCIGLAGRVGSGYKSKECHESYDRAEKKRSENWDKLMAYPENWVDAAYLIKYLRGS